MIYLFRESIIASCILLIKKNDLTFQGMSTDIIENHSLLSELQVDWKP